MKQLATKLADKSLMVFFLMSTAVLAFVHPFEFDDTTHTVTEGDFNGDGKPDVFVQPLAYNQPTGIFLAETDDPLFGADIQVDHWLNHHPDIEPVVDWSARRYTVHVEDVTDSTPGDELILNGKPEILMIGSLPISIRPQPRHLIVQWDADGNASYFSGLETPRVFRKKSDEENQQLILTWVAPSSHLNNNTRYRIQGLRQSDGVYVVIQDGIEPSLDGVRLAAEKAQLFSGFRLSAYQADTASASIEAINCDSEENADSCTLGGPITCLAAPLCTTINQIGFR